MSTALSLDPALLVEMFPWADRPEISPQSLGTTSPSGIAYMLQLRSIVTEGLNPLVRTPTDIFTFGKGEPKIRSATKIGGIPFRPQGVPWPTGRNGQPMTFVAQVDFSGSRDIGVTPVDDVLLIFCPDPLECVRYDAECENDVVFEWHPKSLQRPMSSEEMPKLSTPLNCLYGVPIRVDDWEVICDERALERLRVEMRPALDMYSEGTRQYLPGKIMHRVCVWPNVKIGGRSNIDPPSSGNLLFTLTDITPGFDYRFPWVNEEEPLDMFAAIRQSFVIGDGFILEVWQQPAGDLTWRWEF